MIRGNVETTSTILTDALVAYKGLDREFAKHEVIYHDKNEYVRGFVHINKIWDFFAYFKRSIFGIYHQVSPKHLQRYCNENGYRYNMRKMIDPERFNMSLQNIERRLTYKKLIGEKK